MDYGGRSDRICEPEIDCMLGFALGLSQNPRGSSKKIKKRIDGALAFPKHQKLSKNILALENYNKKCKGKQNEVF